MVYHKNRGKDVDIRKLIHDRGLSRPQRSVKHTLSDDEVEDALNVRPLPDDLEVGSKIFVDATRFAGKHAQRYYLVVAIYRVDEKVVGVDALDMSTSIQNPYPADYAVTAPDERRALKADKPVVITTNRMITIPNMPEYFVSGIGYAGYQNGGPGVLPEDLWSAVVVRQAITMLGSSSISYYCSPDFDFEQEGLVREGITLDIPEWAVRSGSITPFIAGGDFERVETEFLNRAAIDEIVVYANRYVHRMLPHNQLTKVIRPQCEWPLGLVGRPFRNWQGTTAAAAESSPAAAPGITLG